MSDKKEGELFKTIEIEGVKFPVYYGYYSPCDKGLSETVPIFPDFIKEPLYSLNGAPFVTADQDLCQFFKPKKTVSGENWCNDCKFFSQKGEIIGLCSNENRRRKK